jgi:hypothetical protein
MKPSPLTGQAGIMKTAHSGLIKIATCLPGLYPDLQYGTSYVLYRANYNHWKILYPTFSVNSIFSCVYNCFSFATWNLAIIIIPPCDGYVMLDFSSR